LKLDHPGRQVLNAHFPADPKLADRIVLAKNTFQRAAGKKDRVGPARSGYGRLFALMQVYCGDLWKTPNPAIAKFASIAVDAAGAGA